MTQPMKDLADRTLRDWAQAAEENPVLKARVKVLKDALEEIEDLGANGATAARLGNIAHAALLQLKAGS